MIENTKNNSLTIVAVIAVMLCVSGVYLYYQQQNNQTTVKSEGIALARLLSSFDWSQDNKLNVNNVEQLFKHQLANKHFAYGVVVDAEGGAFSNTVSADHLGQLPVLTEISATQGWLNLRNQKLNDRPLLELYGPLHGSHENDPVYFRIAYWQPSFMVSLQDLPVIAFLILPVFLLVPLWIFLQNRSHRPISEINEKLSVLADNQSLQFVEISADGELKKLLEGFNHLFSRAQDRIAEVEADSKKLVTEEKFLSYRAERYESILQTVPDGILILDEDYKVAFINQHVETMFRVSRLDVVSTTVDSWCHYEPLTNYVRELKRDGQKVMSQITHIADPRAESRTMGLSTHPLFFAKSPGSNSGLLILIRDISQEVAAKQSRAEFVGSVSHEVKAPLNTIGLYAQMLVSKTDDPDFIVEAQNTILQEVDRMTRLIHNLLSMTQIEMGTFDLDEQRTYLEEVVNECVSMLAHGEEQSRIKIITTDQVTPVKVDKELMRIAISNLMTNALKYSPKDQPVFVELGETPELITLSVVDRGQGIATEEQDKIFKKFYRSENQETQEAPGHGLGLSIAKEILRLHHGSISLQSVLGEGSTFTLELWKRTGIARHAI